MSSMLHSHPQADISLETNRFVFLGYTRQFGRERRFRAAPSRFMIRAKIIQIRFFSFLTFVPMTFQKFMTQTRERAAIYLTKQSYNFCTRKKTFFARICLKSVIPACRHNVRAGRCYCLFRAKKLINC